MATKWSELVIVIFDRSSVRLTFLKTNRLVPKAFIKIGSTACLLKILSDLYLMLITEMESRTRGSRPKTQKNPSPRSRTDFPRTGLFQAKGRNGRGQDQRASVLLQKGFSRKKIANFLQNFRRSPKKKSSRTKL